LEGKDNVHEADFKEVHGNNARPPKMKVSKNLIGLIGILIIAVIVVKSGFYKLDSGYHAVVTRFGEVHHVETEEGFKFKIPVIDNAIKVNVEKRHKMEYGYRTHVEGDETRAPEYKDYNLESLVIVEATGDNSSLILTELIITYKINDAVSYLFNVDDVEGTVRLALESVLRDTVAKHTRDQALLEKQVIDTAIMPALQKKLNGYGTGVLVTEVKTQNNTLLPSVEEAYRQVEQSNQIKNSRLEQAQKYRNTVIPAAAAEATAVIESAKSYKANVLANARSEVAQFNALYSEYIINPDIVKEQYYIETMIEFLKNNNIVIDGTSGEGIYKFYNMTEGNSIPEETKEKIAEKIVTTEKVEEEKDNE